jgi:hypothetical protein
MSRRQQNRGGPLRVPLPGVAALIRPAAVVTRSEGGSSSLIAVTLHYALLPFVRLITRAITPTRMRLTAQAASRLNQLRATNLRPRWR